MANNTETINIQVKSDIKGVAKDQKEWNKELKKTKENIEDVNEEGKEVVAEMQILGISINGLKAAWRSAAAGARFMFRSIKTGIASTGVGLLLLAFGSLATWFASTKAGAEALSVAFKGVGAAINVIIDRIAKFGGGIAKMLSGKWSEGLKDMGNSFKGMGKEILTDTLLVMALEKQVQKLTDSQRELNVETAQRRADIEELKLIAEDVTKSEKERLDAAKEAFEIETDLLDRRIANAEEAVRIEQLRLSTVLDPSAEQLDVLAQKEIELANIRGESLTKQIELNNKINAIEAQVAADRAARHQDRLDQIEAERQASEDLYNAQIAQADAWLVKVKTLAEKEIALSKSVKDAKVGFAQSGLSLISQIASEGGVIAKTAAVTAVTIAGIEGVQNAFTTAAGSPITKVMPAYPFIQAGLAGVFSALQISKILSGSPGGGGGGGGGSAAAAPPSPQMMSGAFELTGGQPIEPTRAYVVSDDITSSQDALAIIRRRATI